MMRTLLCTALALSIFSTPLLADGWPRPKGHGYYQLSQQVIRARQFYANDEQIIDINGSGTVLSSYTTSFYGEFGLTNRLTAIAYVPFLVRSTVNEGVGEITGEILQPGLENTAFGDVDLGLRYSFFQKNSWVLSAGLTLGLPTGDSDNEDLLYSGDGEFNQLVKMEWGYGANRWYASGHLGLNNRTENFSDEWRFLAEAGYWIMPQRLLAQARFITVQSFNNGNPTGSGNGLFANNVEYLSPQLGLIYAIDPHWGVSFNVGGAVQGRNALAAPAFTGGVYAMF